MFSLPFVGESIFRQTSFDHLSVGLPQWLSWFPGAYCLPAHYCIVQSGCFVHSWLVSILLGGGFFLFLCSGSDSFFGFLSPLWQSGWPLKRVGQYGKYFFILCRRYASQYAGGWQANAQIGPKWPIISIFLDFSQNRLISFLRYLEYN